LSIATVVWPNGALREPDGQLSGNAALDIDGRNWVDCVEKLGLAMVLKY